MAKTNETFHQWLDRHYASKEIYVSQRLMTDHVLDFIPLTNHGYIFEVDDELEGMFFRTEFHNGVSRTREIVPFLFTQIS